MSKMPNLHLQINYLEGSIQSTTLSPSASKGIKWSFCSPKKDQKLENSVNEWMEGYAQKKDSEQKFTYDWSSLPAFTQIVLIKLSMISLGTVYTYGQIASLVDSPQSARAVGGACRRNPFPLLIPCHRVIDAKRELRGYSAGGIGVKESLLIFEGAETQFAHIKKE